MALLSVLQAPGTYAIWCTHLVPELEIGNTDLAQTLMMASSYLDVTSYLPRTKGFLPVLWYTDMCGV